MNSRPDFTDPFEAARVSTFMEAAEHGRWKIVPFTISERHARLSHLAALAEGGMPEEQRMRAERTIPPGDYISLQRRATEQEKQDITDGLVVDAFTADADPDYVPIMSDTPSEIREHSMAINDAFGDVVITGLGLGCIVSALLAKPDVWSITVVEIDRDVIALTGPYYEDEPRVTIVNMDALAAARHFEAEDRMFDYGWHDIWSHIADRNLDDDDQAEHGISYETMFEAWSRVCDQQEAWAYNEARAMDHFRQLARERLYAWADAFTDPAATDEQRLYLLHHFHVVQRLPSVNLMDEIPDDVFAFVMDSMGVVKATAMQIEARGGMDNIIADVIARRRDFEEEKDPMGRPNDVPEANVAR